MNLIEEAVLLTMTLKYSNHHFDCLSNSCTVLKRSIINTHLTQHVAFIRKSWHYTHPWGTSVDTSNFD